MTEEFDVVVVGAGPVGLLCAIELALGGVAVLVLERLAAPSTLPKALGLGPLAAEALARRGMAEPIAQAEAATFAAIQQNGGGVLAGRMKFSGHFGGLFIRRDAQAEPDRRMRAVNQQALETVLNARAQALGIKVRRGCEVTGFQEYPDGVSVAWASDDTEGVTRCAYLVGCDGGRSPIRKQTGVAFPGTPPSLTMYQAILDIDHPERLAAAGWNRTPAGVFSYGIFPRRLFMLDFSGPPADRTAPVTLQEIESVLRCVSEADVRVTGLEVAGRWTDHTRLVDSYRVGRVLLAGDAAHVHSPFGGQGLGLGLGDAANLGWKLAAVARGDLPDSLLDTYTAERRPVAQAVLHNTLAQLAIMRPDPQSGAMRDILARLMHFDDVSRLLGETISGLGERYDLGDQNPTVGRQVADRPLPVEGRDTTLYQLMQDGWGVLLDPTEDGAASRLAREGTARLHCVRVPGEPGLLLRPDACVVWAGHDRDTLPAALRRWFPAR